MERLGEAPAGTPPPDPSEAANAWAMFMTSSSSRQYAGTGSTPFYPYPEPATVGDISATPEPKDDSKPILEALEALVDLRAGGARMDRDAASQEPSRTIPKTLPMSAPTNSGDAHHGLGEGGAEKPYPLSASGNDLPIPDHFVRAPNPHEMATFGLAEKEKAGTDQPMRVEPHEELLTKLETAFEISSIPEPVGPVATSIYERDGQANAAFAPWPVIDHVRDDMKPKSGKGPVENVDLLSQDASDVVAVLSSAGQPAGIFSQEHPTNFTQPQPADERDGSGIESAVEILDLEDPETEAEINRQAEDIRARKAHEERAREGRGGTEIADEVVVIDSGDEAEAENVIDLSLDSAEHAHRSRVGVATAGDFFGTPGNASAHAPRTDPSSKHHAFQVYGSMSAPKEEFDKNAIKQLVQNNNMSADATEEIENPEALAVNLLRHQKRAVAWMIKRERRGADPVLDGEASLSGTANGFAQDDDDDSEDDNPFADMSSLSPCLGGILADEQGLGKTLSVIGLMVANPPDCNPSGSSSWTDADGGESVAVSGDSGRSASAQAGGGSNSFGSSSRAKWRTLIVCPVSLVGQWKDEIETKIRPEYEPRVYIYHGPKRCRDPAKLSKYDVVITTYATLTNEYPKVLRGDPMYAALKKAKQPVPRRPGGPLYACDWFRAVLDESHVIKNRRTESWAAASQLPAARRWCLTGTPIQNSVDDIYSLFCFIRYRFMVKNNYKTWNERWKKKLESSHAGTRKKAFQRFQAIVGIVTLRRTKMDKIDGQPLISLPQRHASVTEMKFKSSAETDFYNAVRDNTNSELDRLQASGNIRQNYSGIMLLLLRLRQACCHPFLIEHASRKARQSLAGAGSKNFASPYSVEELDNIQELVENGVSSFSMLSDGAQEDMLRELAPPKPGESVPPCPDLFQCKSCSRHFVCENIRVLRVGTYVCRACADIILREHTTGRPEDDPFLELDDIRKEVHVKVRTERWLGQNGEKRPRVEARRGAESKRPSSKKMKTQGKQGSSSTTNGDDINDSEGSLECYEEVPEKMRAKSTKVLQILEVLEAMRRRDATEKCLIFSQWTSMLDIIGYHISVAGFQYARLDGKMPLPKRKQEVTRFRSTPSVSVFLISMHAGGTGLNLTEANNVILADCWFNPSVEEQCCDRAHRIGQVRPVTITRFKVLGTVEEKIFEMCKRKAETCKAALGEGGAKSLGRQKMTLEDALSLFGDVPTPEVQSVPVDMSNPNTQAVLEAVDW